MITYQIFQAWKHKELFTDACYWLANVEGADWDWSRGTSYINGVRYPAAVSMLHEEDFLIFKIKFSELLDHGVRL